MNAPQPDHPLLSNATRADIQGFITSGYAHLPDSAFLFLRFEERAGARHWLRQVLSEVTFANSWRTTPNHRKTKPPDTVNVAFTAPGLRVLGLPETCAATFPKEFLDGSSADGQRSRDLGDTGASAPGNWQIGGPANPPVHAVLILNAESPAGLKMRCKRWEAWAAACHGVSLVACEFGSRPEHGKEPFGFRDGISQPDIKGVKKGGGGVNTGEFILGYPNEYGYHTANPLLDAADDPHERLLDSANPKHTGKRDFGMNGTFVVYRKLGQDVAAFWRFLESESLRLRRAADPGYMVWLAAKLVGRWPSGAPLTLAPEYDDPALQDANEFSYATADARGLGCPFGAHIRRSNPRDLIRPAGPEESLRMSARHRILRRGKPYGPPLFDLTVLDRLNDLDGLRAILGLRDDGQARGLHFFCINASIKSQFEFMQQVWANNPHFNGLRGCRDPLIGDNGRPNDPSSLLIPSEDLDHRTAPMPRFVTVLGGAYLFMPSRRAMTYLAQP